MPSARAIKAGKAVIELGMPTAAVEKAMKNLAVRAKVIGSQFQMVGKVGMAAGGAIAAAFVPTIKAASNLEETMNKFNVVFGQSSKEVKAWGDTFAKEVGRSQRQIADFMAGSQDLFVPLGFAADAATDMSKQVTKLALDLASFNNMADGDTLRDLHAALTGSGEVMKKYGVIVSEAAVKQELLNQAIDPKYATDQQKVQARLNIIMRGTTAAQGDAIRSAGSFANQMKALQGKLEDVAATIGQAILPTVTDFVNKLVDVSRSAGAWAEQNAALIATVAKIGVGVAAAGAAVYAIGTAFKTAAGAATALRVAMVFLSANPMVLAIGAVAAAIGALTLHLRNASSAAFDLADGLALVGKRDAEAQSNAAAALARLHTLAQMPKLTHDEAQEVRTLAHQLRNLYGITAAEDAGGGLGVRDGKVVGLDLAEAQIEAARAASSKTKELLQQELAQLNIAPDTKENRVSKGLIENQIAMIDAAVRRARPVPGEGGGVAPGGGGYLGRILGNLDGGRSAAVMNNAKNAGAAIVDGFKFGTTLLDATLIKANQKGALEWARVVEGAAAEAVAAVDEGQKMALEKSSFSEAIFDTRFAAQQFGGSGDKQLRELQRQTKVLERIERGGGLNVV